MWLNSSIFLYGFCNILFNIPFYNFLDTRLTEHLLLIYSLVYYDFCQNSI